MVNGLGTQDDITGSHTGIEPRCGAGKDDFRGREVKGKDRTDHTRVGLSHPGDGQNDAAIRKNSRIVGKAGELVLFCAGETPADGENLLGHGPQDKGAV